MSSNGASMNHTKIKMEIETQHNRLMECWENKNVKILADLYTSSCSIMPPEASINYGRPGVSRIVNQLLDAGCHVIRLQTGELELPSQNLAVERGGYKFCTRDKQIVETGKYVKVWKRMEGELKIHMHIWNRNQ